MNDIKNNKLRGVTAIVLRSTVLLCSTGILMQTFLIVLGFSSAWIYIRTTLIQGVSLLTIILCSRFADKNVIRRAALVQIPGALLFLCYLPFCFAASNSAAAFALLVMISLAQSVATALQTVCGYKSPYYLYKTAEYGEVMAFSGGLSFVVTFAAGVLMSRLSATFSYVTLMFFAFSFAAVGMLGSAILSFFQKSLLTEEKGAPVQKEKLPMSRVFKSPVFLTLWPAHLLRGFAFGTTTVLAVLAVDLGFDETVTTLMVSVQSAASLAGVVCFGFLSKRFAPRLLVFAGSISFLAIPVLLFPDRYAFLAACAVILFGRTLIDYALVSALLYAVPMEIAGPYNAWRMVLHNGGTLLATTVAALIPPSALLLVSLAASVISGILFLTLKVMKQSSPPVLK